MSLGQETVEEGEEEGRCGHEVGLDAKVSEATVRKGEETQERQFCDQLEARMRKLGGVLTDQRS